MTENNTAMENMELGLVEENLKKVKSNNNLIGVGIAVGIVLVTTAGVIIFKKLKKKKVDELTETIEEDIDEFEDSDEEVTEEK